MAPPVKPDQPAPKKQDPLTTVFFGLVITAVVAWAVIALVNKITTPAKSTAFAVAVEVPPYITEEAGGPLDSQDTRVITKLGGSVLQGFFHPTNLVLAGTESLAGGQVEIVTHGFKPGSKPRLKVSPEAVFTAMGDMEAYAEHHPVEHFSIDGNVYGEVSFRVQPASQSVRYLIIDSTSESIREFWPDNMAIRSAAYPNAVASFLNEESARVPSILDKRVPEGLYRFYQGICEDTVQAKPVADLLKPSTEDAFNPKAFIKGPVELPPYRLPQQAGEHLVCESQAAALAFARSGIPYSEYKRTMGKLYSQTFEGELIASYRVVNSYEYEHDITVS